MYKDVDSTIGPICPLIKELEWHAIGTSFWAIVFVSNPTFLIRNSWKSTLLTRPTQSDWVNFLPTFQPVALFLPFKFFLLSIKDNTFEGCWKVNKNVAWPYQVWFAPWGDFLIGSFILFPTLFKDTPLTGSFLYTYDFVLLSKLVLALCQIIYWKIWILQRYHLKSLCHFNDL